jgi:hypothetical protein
MKNLFSNLWLQLASVTTIFICTLATDWIGITAYFVYFALWIWFKYEEK